LTPDLPNYETEETGVSIFSSEGSKVTERQKPIFTAAATFYCMDVIADRS